jgi:HAE1 family hydrophobic/amphiphilic exporter-1
VVIDRDRAYSFGLTVAGIANEIDASVDGKTATTFRENGDEYSVVLSLQEADRAKVPDLEKIFVAASDRPSPPGQLRFPQKGRGAGIHQSGEQARIIHVEGGRRRATERTRWNENQGSPADNFVAPRASPYPSKGSGRTSWSRSDSSP